MNNIERIQAIIVTLLGAAQVGAKDLDECDYLKYDEIHDDLMNRIVNQSDEAVDLIARRLVEVANYEE